MKKTILMTSLAMCLVGCSLGQNRTTTIVNSKDSKVEVLASWVDVRLMEDNVLFRYSDSEVTCYMSEPGGLFCFQK